MEKGRVCAWLRFERGGSGDTMGWRREDLAVGCDAFFEPPWDLCMGE